MSNHTFNIPFHINCQFFSRTLGLLFSIFSLILWVFFSLNLFIKTAQILSADCRECLVREISHQVTIDPGDSRTWRQRVQFAGLVIWTCTFFNRLFLFSQLTRLIPLFSVAQINRYLSAFALAFSAGQLHFHFLLIKSSVPNFRSNCGSAQQWGDHVGNRNGHLYQARMGGIWSQHWNSYHSFHGRSHS